MLGTCVGTGNVWRFARIVAKVGRDDGTGAFLLLWAFFLFSWAIPLIIAEYAIGRYVRKGIVECYVAIGGERFRSLGVFTAACNGLCGFYYAVVSGWCLFYAFYFMFHELPTSDSSAQEIFDDFSGNGLPVLFLALTLLLSVLCLLWGVKSIERANAFFVPVLLVILIICFFWSITLDDAGEGLGYLFFPDFTILGSARTFIEALAQISYDTGAGSSLFLAYAVFLKQEDHVVWSAFGLPIANNVVSLLSAMTTFATTFAVLRRRHSRSGVIHILQTTGPAGTGLTFVWFPVLFEGITGGRVLCVFFFIGLYFAAVSSLLALIEVFVRPAVDWGFSRRQVTLAAHVLVFLGGLPSALSLHFLANQDFVWGAATLIMGLIEAAMIIRFGVKKFREEVINTKESKDYVRQWFVWTMQFLVPVEGTALFLWWAIEELVENPEWYNPFLRDSLATFVLQAAILFAIVYAVVFGVMHRKQRGTPSGSSRGGREEGKYVRFEMEEKSSRPATLSGDSAKRDSGHE